MLVVVNLKAVYTFGICQTPVYSLCQRVSYFWYFNFRTSEIQAALQKGKESEAGIIDEVLSGEIGYRRNHSR